MDVVLLSRLQFAVTIAFHFIFPCISIGLAWLNVIFLTKYRKSKSEDDLRLSYFWVNLFGITFAMGAATGVVMVFQFGSNWSDFTQFAASMFVPPLVAEATLAFFLEATFLGILIWGRGKVGRTLYLISSVMVAVGATLSAFIIVAVDSWMQTPAGYKTLEGTTMPALEDGKMHLDNFFEAIFNSSIAPRITHTLIACFIAGAGFVLGISAWYLLKKKKQEFAMKSMSVAIVVLLVCSVLQWVVGHWHTVQVVEDQPLKLAAFEGLFETTEGAELLIFGIPDQEKEETNFKIGIPKMLSFLGKGDFNAKITGIKDAAAAEGVPKEEWPPILLAFFSYRTMLAFGAFFLLLSLWGLFLKTRKKIQDSRLFLRIALITIPFGFIAANIGWMAAEVGRQPWIIQGIMKTSDAVSDKVPAEQVLMSLIIFSLIYTILAVAYIFLIKRKVEEGPDAISLTGSHTEGRIEA